jgi:hypothetical protein
LNMDLTNSLFSFYPNPNNGRVSIIISREEENDGKGYIRLADFSGKVHFLQEIEMADGMQVLVFEFELPAAISNGTYSLSVITGANSASEKFILMR